MDTIRSSFIFQVEIFWHKYARTIVCLFILVLPLLAFIVMKGMVHISHLLLLADGGSTPLPGNSGGGGPWS